MTDDARRTVVPRRLTFSIALLLAAFEVGAGGKAPAAPKAPPPAGGVVKGTLEIPGDVKPPEGPEQPILTPNGFLAIQPPVLDPRGDMVVYLQPGAGAPALPAPAQHATMTLEGSRLVPATLAIPVGGAVDFVVASAESDTHRLFAPDIPAFAAQDQTAGQTRSQTFEVAGQFDVRDAAVPHVHGEVLVFQSGFFATPDAHGGFAIPGVPDGSYTLEVFYGGAQPIYTAPLAVQNGAQVTIKLPADLAPAAPQGG